MTSDIILSLKYMFHDCIDDVMKWVEMADIYNTIAIAIADSDSDIDEDETMTEIVADTKSDEKQPSQLTSSTAAATGAKRSSRGNNYCNLSQSQSSKVGTMYVIIKSNIPSANSGAINSL